MQVLLGKLHFVSACVRQGRVFVSRLINHMKTLPFSGRWPLPESVKKDIECWTVFLHLSA